MSDIKLFYFNGRGRAEFIRLVLTAAGEKFEDIRFPRDSWGPEIQKDTPYGKLPYVIYKGKKYGQSIAIGVFFAKKLGYYGQTAEDDLRQDEVIHLVEDLRTPRIRVWVFEKDAEKKAELEREFREELFPRFLDYFENLLKDNGGTGFFVRDAVSFADFYVYDFLDTVLGINPEALNSFPCLQKLRSNVEALPTLKEYLATRSKSHV